jgi:hypothetical protein
MILLRAIKGDDYAKKIDNGMISLRDVLSTITNDIETGYEYSNYKEEYFQYALKSQIQPPINISEFNKKMRLKLLLTFNRTVPYIYLTYFHILNENSVKDWLDSTSDDMSYIFIEPKLDSICSNMSGLNYIGKELCYTTDLNTVNKDQSFINMAGILQFLDRDMSRVKDNELIINYTGYISNLCFTLFHRVEDAKFNSKEKEFRIIYKVPTPINSFSGEICPEQERIFSLLIDGKDKYKGETDVTHIEGELMCCDMKLTAVNPLMAVRKTSLITEVRKGKDFSILSEFRDVDIRDSVKRYGYIGNKEQCLAFINNELEHYK